MLSPGVDIKERKPEAEVALTENGQESTPKLTFHVLSGCNQSRLHQTLVGVDVEVGGFVGVQRQGKQPVKRPKAAQYQFHVQVHSLQSKAGIEEGAREDCRSALIAKPHVVLTSRYSQRADAFHLLSTCFWRRLRSSFNPEKHRLANPSISSSVAAFGRVEDIQFEGEEVYRQPDSKRVFGQHAVITLDGCNLTTISSGDAIGDFAAVLVEAIEMKGFGKPFVEHFADDNEVAAGYLLAQMIETSLISCHFSEHWRAAYLDIFLCEAFSTAKAVDVATSFSQADSARVKVLLR